MKRKQKAKLPREQDIIEPIDATTEEVVKSFFSNDPKPKIPPKKTKKKQSTPANPGWNEKKIKSVLIDYLLSKNESNNIICSEVSFLSGKRWADILELKENSLVAYEIKSDLDSLWKFKEQLKDYSETFNEVYVVLSRKFKGQEKLLPPEIGYFWVDPGRDKRPLSIGRKARRRTNLKKENLSHFLWKKDISRYLKEPCEDVVLMRNKFTKKNSLKYIHLLAIKALRERYGGRFELFLKEKSAKTHFSEIDILTKKETSIY